MYADKFVRIFIEDILDDISGKMNTIAEYVVPSNFTDKEWENTEDEIAEILVELLDNI